MMFSLKDKHAVVTGAGSGIGRAVALMLAKQGAIVYVADINEAQAVETVELVGQAAAGGSAVAAVREAAAAAGGGVGGGAGGVAGIGGVGACFAKVADVSDQAQVKALFESLPRLDILVNSAGLSHIGTAESTTEADMDRLYKVNVKGVYNCLHAGIPAMKKGGGGVVINVCSIAATVGIPERFAYSMTKGAVYSMTLSVAKDYLKDKIRCNCISPARVHTPFVDGFLQKNYPGKEQEMFEKLSKTQPIGRMAKPEEVAALILYLCSDEAAFITGCDYPIDGGFTKLNN
jgi:2-keto-3-deoxy-L-fuconate dehydrogenase